MSIRGLRKHSNYEEALAQATKDETRVPGVMGQGLHNWATRAVNSIEFQRGKDGLEDNLKEQTKSHLEHQNFQNNLSDLAVEANISSRDLQTVVDKMAEISARHDETQHAQATQITSTLQEMTANNMRVQAELDVHLQRFALSQRDHYIAMQALAHHSAEAQHNVLNQVAGMWAETLSKDPTPVQHVTVDARTTHAPQFVDARMTHAPTFVDARQQTQYTDARSVQAAFFANNPGAAAQATGSRGPSQAAIGGTPGRRALQYDDAWFSAGGTPPGGSHGGSHSGSPGRHGRVPPHIQSAQLS